ncbi:MAG: hypothetical protein R3330_17795, partial [Saprospiraceae bacterium]|nr:hypothetical protein [Saprospiraceae bacterium]
EAQKIRISPSAGAWQRLEARLEARRARRSARISRVVSYAAGIILLVGLSIGSFYYFNKPDSLPRSGYSATIMELEPADNTGQTIYNIEKVRALSSMMLAHHTSEN